MMIRTTLCTAFVAFVAVGWPVAAAGQPPAGDLIEDPAAVEAGGDLGADGATNDIKEMMKLDLDQLGKVDVVAPSLDIEVSSVSKQESTVGRSPAAIFVITPEMIRRSGATCIPELLRMVPGLDVAQADSHTWVISPRGFSDRFASKLLVLIDGRSVYTPMFSGVYWDTQDLLLEDIERIEVIRGPGSTLWGANAVNGVINIMTRKAQDTQGALITSGGGTHDRTVNGVRYGGKIGQGLYWRVYGKQFDRGPGYAPGGSRDDWRIGRGGFRVDWEMDPYDCNKLTVQGDYYGGKEGFGILDVDPASGHFLENIYPDEEVSGANVLARFTHVFDDDSDWALQLYHDRTLRNQPFLRQEIHTFDADFQHRFPLGTRNSMIWGFDLRRVHDYMSFQPFTVGFIPPKRTTTMFSMFVQDQLTVVEDRLFFTAGTKLEHNDYTGFEYQPGARLLYTPDHKHSLWGAISRAVRVPSRFEQDAYLTLDPFIQPLPFPPWQVYAYPRYTGNRNMRSEDLLAYEAGYRAQVSDRFSYDVAVFYNTYDNLLDFEQGGDFFDPDFNLIVPLDLMNSMYGETYGVELSADWAVTDWWRLSPSYSFLQVQLHSPTSLVTEGAEGSSPHNKVYLRSYWDLPRNWELDIAVRYVDELPTQHTPHYITMDIRLGWSPRENLEFSVVGRNMLDRYHSEYGLDSFNFLTSEVRRNVFAKVTWRR